MSIQVKRVYDDLTANDGFLILVDRLWPRGMSKETLGLDLWLKNVAPSAKLRKWFNHEPGKFSEFTFLYVQELETEEEQRKGLDYLLALIQGNKDRTFTFLYAAKDITYNHANILKDQIEKRIS